MIVLSVIGWTMGLAYCLKHETRLVLANGTSACGLNVMSAIANSQVVKTCMACCVNVRSCQQLGIVAVAAGAGMTAACFLGDTHSAGVHVGGLIIFGAAPGLLFCVTHWCKRGVSLRVLLQLDSVLVKLVAHLLCVAPPGR